MRSRAALIQSSDGAGAGGNVTWTDAITDVPAEKWSVKGSERVEQAMNQHTGVYRWHLRANAAIVSSMRIKWVNAGVTHYQQIKAINTLDNRGRELEIIAEEIG